MTDSNDITAKIAAANDAFRKALRVLAIMHAPDC